MAEREVKTVSTPSSCSFTPDGWNLDDWIMVKSPRSDHFGRWVQNADCIRNEVPPGVPAEVLMAERADETYTSMVHRTPVDGDAVVTVTMSFEHRMAPIIVFAPELGEDSAGRPEYRRHHEVCLFDEGINIWRHDYRDGRPSWVLASYARLPLKPNTPYALEAAILGTVLRVRVDGHEFGYMDPSLPARYYVGITGCEGVNRFYDLRVDQDPSAAARDPWLGAIP